MKKMVHFFSTLCIRELNAYRTDDTMAVIAAVVMIAAVVAIAARLRELENAGSTITELEDKSESKPLGPDSTKRTFATHLFTAIVFIYISYTYLIWYFSCFEANPPGIVDVIGGSGALFSALALAGIISAIILQRQDLALQRRDYQRTTEILRETKLIEGHKALREHYLQKASDDPQNQFLAASLKGFAEYSVQSLSTLADTSDKNRIGTQAESLKARLERITRLDTSFTAVYHSECLALIEALSHFRAATIVEQPGVVPEHICVSLDALIFLFTNSQSYSPMNEDWGESASSSLEEFKRHLSEFCHECKSTLT